MTHFVGRNKEIQFLEDEFAQDRASLVILYGRRRIGKTTLIKQFIQEKNVFYFVATEESERENRRNFQHAVSDFTHNPLLKKDVLLEWDEIFSVLNKHQPDKKKIIAIDEFQYLGKARVSFPSIFQKIWDQMLAESRVMVILCGSLVGMMVEQTLSYSSPLYGRRTGQIRLDQIGFQDYGLFFRQSEDINLIEYYAVTGGVPKYIELFSPDPDIFQAMEKNILSKQSFLFEEPVFLLEKEFGETGTYFSLIKTIAAGNRKLGKIASALGLNQSGLTKYLKTLQELDLIVREVPVTEKNPEKSKKGLYRITDNFISFWFKFVHPYRSYLEMEHTEIVIKKIKDQFRSSHVSFVYEDICRQWLMQQGLGDLPHIQLIQAGRWWSRDVEIDLLGISENLEHAVFGECKYTAGPVDADVYWHLKEKAKSVILPEVSKKHYVFFSQSGFTEAMMNLAGSQDNVHLATIA
ncbi:ATP-binding protein [Desulfonatronovibrio hydrogenovorans]|uniref:ATP-binding protein n=1 Tax=Desulfonatronovibrio hydrogenovorans TaxID=53245 RepID=UPI00048F053A|nr:ATP-binding protein [Desulfonatronovibrio hydrogenovorans]